MKSALLLILLFTITVAEDLDALLDSTFGMNLYAVVNDGEELSRTEQVMNTVRSNEYRAILAKLDSLTPENPVSQDTVILSKLVTCRSYSHWNYPLYQNGLGVGLERKGGGHISSYSTVIKDGHIQLSMSQRDQFRQDRIKKGIAIGGSSTGAVLGATSLVYLLVGIFDGIFGEEPTPIYSENGPTTYHSEESDNYFAKAAVTGGMSLSFTIPSIILYHRASSRQIQLILDHNRNTLAERFQRTNEY